MRVLGIKALTVAAVITVFTLMVTPRLSHAQPMVEPYCCVCNSCTQGALLQCVPVAAPGTKEADCTGICTRRGCQFVEVLDGTCTANAGTCMPSPAPAASRSVLLLLATLLAGGGIYLVRRRVTG